MDDRELFERFSAFARENGYTADQAAKMIGATRASYFNWKRGGRIGARYRRAMLVLTYGEQEKKEERKEDHFFTVILESWPELSIEERAKLAAQAASFAEQKKTDAAGGTPSAANAI